MRGWDVRIKPGFSFAGKKKGLLVDSSTITTLVGGTVEDEGTLDEFEAMIAKKKSNLERKLCLVGTKVKENLLWYHVKIENHWELRERFERERKLAFTNQETVTKFVTR